MLGCATISRDTLGTRDERDREWKRQKVISDTVDIQFQCAKIALLNTIQTPPCNLTHVLFRVYVTSRLY